MNCERRFIVSLIIVLITSMIIVNSCSKGPEDARKELGKMNIPYSEGSFFNVIKNGDHVAVNLFLISGLKTSLRDSEGKTPLILASEYGKDDIIKLLIDNGSNVNDKENKFGSTALHFAAFYGHLNAINILLGKGALLDERDVMYDSTPLMSAALGGHIDVVKLLIEKGAKVDTKNNDGITPLIAATAKGNIDIVNIFINKSAMIDVKEDEYGWTALHIAANKGFANIAKVLLDKGADPNAQDKAGNIPLELAVDQRHNDAMAVLNNVKYKEIKISNIKYNYGDTNFVLGFSYYGGKPPLTITAIYINDQDIRKFIITYKHMSKIGATGVVTMYPLYENLLYRDIKYSSGGFSMVKRIINPILEGKFCWPPDISTPVRIKISLTDSSSPPQNITFEKIIEQSPMCIPTISPKSNAGSEYIWIEKR